MGWSSDILIFFKIQAQNILIIFLFFGFSSSKYSYILIFASQYKRWTFSVENFHNCYCYKLSANKCDFKFKNILLFLFFRNFEAHKYSYFSENWSSYSYKHNSFEKRIFKISNLKLSHILILFLFFGKFEAHILINFILIK